MNIDRKARICFNIIVKYFITERMIMGKPNLSYKLKIQSFTVISNIIRYAFLVSFSFILLYPFLYIVVNSFKGISDFFDPTVEWMPKHLYFGNFSKTIKILDFWRSTANTLIYEIAAALIQFCSCAVAAYGLARFKFKGQRLLLGMMVLNILVPSMMIITPSYVNFSHMDFLGIFGLLNRLTGIDLRPNLVNTVFAFYLPSVLGVGLKGGLFIYIFAQFFKGLPRELEEAAWIDGAGPWKTFLSIVVPSSGAASVTVLLFSIVWHWNDYYLAQMYLSEHPVLSVALNNTNINSVINILGGSQTEGQLNAVPIILSGCLLFLLPLIVFYIVIQRKFMASIATSGIVG